MPWKLVEPRQGKTPYWYVRGKYLGIALDDSTGATEERAAKRILKTWKQQAERGEFRQQSDAEPAPATFLSAAVAYMQATGQTQYVEDILNEWGARPLADIDQIAIDTLATTLYPGAPASTKNRQVYTPVSAILKHVGIDKTIKRPKGWRGNKRTFWLQPEPTFRLLDAAVGLDAEFGILCTLLNYTGLRISEALDELTCEGVELAREFAYIGETKTDEPRGVYLPPIVVAALASHPRGLERRGRLFRFHDGGRLRDMLKAACRRADIVLPRRTAFHVFRHNYGTWMRLHAGLDDLGLTRTGVWQDRASVARYSHSEATAEARQAIKLPTPKRGAHVESSSTNVDLDEIATRKQGVR
jgi:integrase